MPITRFATVKADWQRDKASQTSVITMQLSRQIAMLTKTKQKQKTTNQPNQKNSLRETTAFKKKPQQKTPTNTNSISTV